MHRGSAKECRHLKSDLAPGLYASTRREAHPDLHLVALNFSWPWTFSALPADPVSATQTFLPDPFPATGRDTFASRVSRTDQNPRICPKLFLCAYWMQALTQAQERFRRHQNKTQGSSHFAEGRRTLASAATVRDAVRPPPQRHQHSRRSADKLIRHPFKKVLLVASCQSKVTFLAEIILCKYPPRS